MGDVGQTIADEGRPHLPNGAIRGRLAAEMVDFTLGNHFDVAVQSAVRWAVAIATGSIRLHKNDLYKKCGSQSRRLSGDSNDLLAVSIMQPRG